MNPDILVAQIAHLSAENARLRGHIARLHVDVLAEKGAMLAVCKTAGGYVKGHSTGPHNILGRIRELIEIERRHLFPTNVAT